MRVERRFLVNAYYRGPISLTSLDVRLAFADIYAQTNVPFVVHPVHADDDPVLS